MKIFIQSIDPGARNAIVKGPFISSKEVNGELVPKEWDEMKDDEKRKVGLSGEALQEECPETRRTKTKAP